MNRKQYDRLTLIGAAALSIFPISFAVLFFVMLEGPLPSWIFSFSFAVSVVCDYCLRHVAVAATSKE